MYHSSNHWANGDTVVLYIEKAILPYFRQIRASKELPESQPGLCIFDVFRGHQTQAVEMLLEENKFSQSLFPTTVQIFSNVLISVSTNL